MREPRAGLEIWQACRSGADDTVRDRLGEFRAFFRDHGSRLTGLKDPLCAASVGASLSAPFISVTDLMGLPREIVLDAVARMGTAEARAALLALAAASDGQLETLALRAAATMDGGGEPPWAEVAREPLRLLTTDRLRDRDDDRMEALIVAFRQGRYDAVFVMRFHPASLLTARILFLPETTRSAALADFTSGRGAADSYHFTRKLKITETRESMVGLVGGLLRENELNLRMGRGYPPDLDQLSRLADVEIVPAVLVLLRKFVLSAYGIGAWDDVDHGPLVWP
ncbi:hypothetical protein Aab01nite_43170 [Paractinoplanes abujensis]|uniref:Uncharacterized protein n=1 Tax=Paractinoplanes abujensis TaxID=882441 RepID=A0A7W7G1D2_9ACTN|nr:hypothetical protein [Actinoplanes abujensis]MBB4694058.1 hypothetical protein [Actinoplanes abujensis]GID20727.1 hypothetical protein Aab01nite_43170 [Actinoplanes abujensis]